MFRKLCGDNVLHNVVIVTTMWGVVDVGIGAARERELATDDILFKPVLDLGARMTRYMHNAVSAQAALIYVINNRPEPLRIQRELVDERKDIEDTDAGQELLRELAAMMKKHQEQLAALQTELQEALKAKDVESAKELESARNELSARIAQTENDRARLSREFAEEKRQTERTLSEFTEALSEEATLRDRRERELTELISEADRSRHAAAADRARWESELDGLLQQQASHRSSIFAAIGDAIDMVMGVATVWAATNGIALLC